MWRTLLSLAVHSIESNRKRTVLTLLGIVVGTLTLILVLSLGNGLQQIIYQQLGSLASDNVYLEVKSPDTVKSAGLSMLQITTLDEKDEQDVLALPNVQRAYGWYNGQGKLQYGQGEQTVTIMAVGADYAVASGLSMQSGRFYTLAENASQKRVIVLGKKLAAEVSPQGEAGAIGQTVKLLGKSFTVVGVLAEQGTQGFFDPDKGAYVPVKTAQKQLFGIDHYQAIVAQLLDMEQADKTIWQMTQILRRNHHITDPAKDDFRITSYDEVLSIVGDITGGVSLLLGVIAGISLLVGGVGIMNVMYVTVAERTKEIGLRKALGAPEASIMRQFLIEAVLVTALGGGLGAVLGVLMAWGLSVVGGHFGYGWAFVFPWEAVGIGMGTVLLIGFVFGYSPARRASLLDPITALRSE
ncbi:ABC transporter permease [Candidatus Peribacteria bacterium]|nr:ABC transporter permease [Candidatus Peribacteria bacterium]